MSVDSFGGGGTLFYSGSLQTQLYEVPSGGGGGPMKIADNSSPLPRGRAFINYNYFSDAIRTSSTGGPNGNLSNTLNVNRYTFGWEQCFLDGMYSLEVRVPFSPTLDSTQTFLENADSGTEFGHVVGTFKGLLYQDEFS